MTLYDERVTTVSLDTLKTIVGLFDFPVCLCGGWAVYFTINDYYQVNRKRDYLGSQDIDIGFFLSPMISKTEFESTSLFKTLNLLRTNGFLQDGFRYRKNIIMEDQTENLGSSEPEIFELYVDILVNSYPPSISDIYPNYFFEVPLIAEVYADERNLKHLSNISNNLFMPSRPILTAMKIQSFPSRGKQDHKKIKDLCDIYGLLWFSERSVHDNMKDARIFTDIHSLRRMKTSIDDSIKADCERYLGEPEGSMDTLLQIINDYI
jgi:hypothetical protein